MLITKIKNRYISTFLAIIIVFLMSAGAFIGAAQNSSLDLAFNESSSLTPVNPTAEKSNENILEPNLDTELEEQFDPHYMPSSDFDLNIDDNPEAS